MKHLLPLTFFSIASLQGAIPLRVNPMFSDHMVLQQGMPIPVWGTAAPGEVVTIGVLGQAKATRSGPDSKWMAILDPLDAAGAPLQMVVSSSAGKFVFNDVLVGEVWFGAGQSNMAVKMAGAAKKDPVLARHLERLPVPGLRLFSNGWHIAGRDKVLRFSALQYSFGLELHKKLGVPIGLIYRSSPGTPSRRWLTPGMAEADERFASYFATANGVRLSDYNRERGNIHDNWREQVAKAKAIGKRAPRAPDKIGGLFESRILPCIPYAIRGVLWDQGESKTEVPGVPDQFVVTNALIKGWRKAWGQGDFPFLHVQKPSGGVCAWDPSNPTNHGCVDYDTAKPLPKKRTKPHEMAYPMDHIRMATIPNAPLVPTIDLATGIHPVNKSGYGKRASQVALGAVYGHNVAISGPVYKTHRVEGWKIRVFFNHIGKGLAFRHGDSLDGFEISDGQTWAWADAEIDRNTVVVGNPAITTPLHVQYAFHEAPAFANLFNKDGLPAQPFTTQFWVRKEK